MVPVGPLVSHVIAFVVGALSGVIGQYYATKFTERRQRKESVVELEKTFKGLTAVMPELFKEMREDLSSDKTGLVREAVILQTKGMVYNSANAIFSYYKEQHPDLRNKIAMLAEKGFVSILRDDLCLVFRMSDQFVGLLNNVRSCTTAISVCRSPTLRGVGESGSGTGQDGGV